jgi:hypothetical protein
MNKLTHEPNKQASKQAFKQTNMGTRASAHFKGQQNMQLRCFQTKLLVSVQLIGRVYLSPSVKV